MTKTEKPQDPHTRITERILAELEQGVRPWLKPWSSDALAGRVTRPLRATGEPYRGINVILLWMEAVASGYAAPMWMTYRQAQALGGQVRKGEQGAPVVYYGSSSKTKTDAQTGDEREEGFRFLKSYTVFNVEQIEGLPERFAPVAVEAPAPAFDRIEAAEAFFAGIPAEVRHGGNRAFYSVTDDRIQLPPFEAFHDPESYYATRGHEVCNIASVLVSRAVDGLCALLLPQNRRASLAISGRES
jgi:antirestriction protein ArdC